MIITINAGIKSNISLRSQIFSEVKNFLNEMQIHLLSFIFGMSINNNLD